MITDDPVYMAHVWRLAYAVDHMHDDRPFLQQMIADTSPGDRRLSSSSSRTPPRGAPFGPMGPRVEDDAGIPVNSLAIMALTQSRIPIPKPRPSSA
jgi:hypothetical protein